MGDIRREVNEYNHAVENNSFRRQREVCPRCLVCSDFSRHDCTRRQLEHPRVRSRTQGVRHRGPPVLAGAFPLLALRNGSSSRMCWPKALNYLDRQPPDARASYRESLREKLFPLGYTNQDKGRQLSHVTLWRWLSWLGSLKDLVQWATQLILQKDPRADVHRQSCAVADAKVRSAQRRQTLEQATMTMFPDGRCRKVSVTTLVIQRAVELKKDQPLRSDETINRFLQAQWGQQIPKSTLYRHLKQAGVRV